MAGRRSWRGWRVAAIIVVLLACLVGYAVGDAMGRVPGVLTTAPRPVPYPVISSAPGAVLVKPASAPVPAAGDSAKVPTAAAVAARLGPLLSDPALGPSVSATVIDAGTGTVLLDSGAHTARTPASVTKVLTSAAALSVLGADATFTTKAVAIPGSNQVSLVGGGDVLLAAGHGDPTLIDGRAGLADLAGQVAARLKASGRTTVSVSLDDSILGGLGWGESMGPGWTSSDISSGFVAPVTGLAVDAGRTGPDNYAPRVADPGLAAAQQFSAALQQAGIAVSGSPVRAKASAGAQRLGAVTSAPVSEIIDYALGASDNNAAEALSRSVALAEGGRPTFAGGGAAVLTAVAALGVDTQGSHLADGSGMSQGSALTPAVLAGTLAAATSDAHPQLRPLLRGLPVAGLSGTLADRFTPADGAASGVGIVRAKTGSLTHVSALAGEVVTADGRLVTFAFLADQVPATDPARAALDRLSTAVAGCGCS